MTNSPILPIIPGGAILGSTNTPDDEEKDNQDTVEMDLREADTVNDNLEE